MRKISYFPRPGQAINIRTVSGGVACVAKITIAKIIHQEQQNIRGLASDCYNNCIYYNYCIITHYTILVLWLLTGIIAVYSVITHYTIQYYIITH